jgi:hypothetical protein
MLRHGPHRLLNVVQADATRSAGSLEQLAPGLFVGAIDRLAHDQRWNQLSFGGWRDLCRKVLAHAEPMAAPEPSPLAGSPGPASAPLPAAAVERPLRHTASDTLTAAVPPGGPLRPKRAAHNGWLSRVLKLFRR